MRVLEEDRTLPHNLEAERAVLGSVLINETAWVPTAAVLTGADFYRDSHRRIFEAMSRLVEAKSAPSDILLLMAELRRVDDLDEVGGPAYLTSLTDGLPHAANVTHYCREVLEKAQLRRLVFGANKLLAEAYDAERPSSEILDDSVKNLLQLARVAQVAGATAKQAVDQYLSDLSADKVTPPVPTGFLDVDGLLGGLNRHDLTILAARPSVGKSCLALRMADLMASRGVPTAVFSLEMRVQQLAAQLVAWRSRVPTEDLRRKRATQEQYTAVSNAWADFRDMPLHIESAQTLTQIVAASRRLRKDFGLQCLIVDYVQMLNAPGKHENRQVEVAYISRLLKRLAEDDGLAVVALSQLKRPEKGRSKQDPRPKLSDLRESGALEQDADLAILLYRPEMHQATEENAGLCEVIIAKNRTGPTGVVKLYFQKNLALFRDLAPPV